MREVVGESWVVGLCFWLYMAGMSQAQGVGEREVEIQGDLIVDKRIEWKGGHYKVRGNVLFRPGGVLHAEDCTIEQVNSYAREFRYGWEGGRLETERVTIGGTMGNGLYFQSNFELHDGEWESTDTTVRYTYGIVFGQGEQGGRLRATRLKQGPNPDSVIMTGRGDAVIRDSEYNVSLNMYLDQGGANGDFSLPTDRSLTQVFDGSNVPGAEYRLELVNTKVPLWWIFANQLRMDGPEREVILRDCPSFVACLLGHNLKGELRLPCQWSDGGKPMAPGSTWRTGNLRWRTLDKPAGLSCWGVYLSGAENDVTVRGATLLAELMVFGGRVSVIGDEGTFNSVATGTTIDAGWPGGNTPARISFTNATLGIPRDEASWAHLIGQATAHDKSEITIEGCRLRRIQLITEGSGKIDVRKSTREDVRLRPEGGPIEVSDSSEGTEGEEP